MRQVGATLHRGARASHHCGLSLRSTGSRRACSVIVAHGPSCSAACGIFRDQGSNPCTLHWQADSQPLCHQGSPPWSLWHIPIFVLLCFSLLFLFVLFFSTTRCFRCMLYISHPNPRISHFSKEAEFILDLHIYIYNKLIKKW